MSLMWASHAHEEKGTFWHFSSFLIVYEHANTFQMPSCFCIRKPELLYCWNLSIHSISKFNILIGVIADLKMHTELQLLMVKQSKGDRKVEAAPDNQSTSKTELIVLWANYSSWCHIRTHAHPNRQASSRVHICAIDYQQLVTTCVYANLMNKWLRLQAPHTSKRQLL